MYLVLNRGLFLKTKCFLDSLHFLLVVALFFGWIMVIYVWFLFLIYLDFLWGGIASKSRKKLVKGNLLRHLAYLDESASFLYIQI